MVVDTNVVVAGLITGDAYSPTAKILDCMCKAAFPFLLSVDLLAEYMAVLRRPKVRALHGLPEDELDAILSLLTANGVFRVPPSSGPAAPDPGDNHLWALVGTEPGAALVTGDRALLASPPETHVVISPRQFVDLRP